MISNYFPHDSNSRNSEKIIKLRMKHKAAGYGVYFMILERLRDSKEYMSVKDYNIIAFDLREDASLIKSVIEDFGLFVFTEDGKYFYSEEFMERMKIKDEIKEKKSVAGKKAMLSRWGETSNESRSERLKLAREKGTHTQDEWEEMKDFFGECVKCGKADKIVKDHIIPICKGGSDGIDNIQPLCQECQRRKGGEVIDYRLDWCINNAIDFPSIWITKEDKITNKSLTSVSEITNKSLTKEDKITNKKERKKESIYKKETISKDIEKKEAKASLQPIEKRETVFYENLACYVGKYPKEMIRAFFDYWTEKNKSGTKMRFELEKTWELGRRLSTWASRDKNFTKNAMDVGCVLNSNNTSKYDNEEKWNR